ncbi:MAG TPA: hypothetical protein VHY35_02210 [Stellaceae bacterium]|jgi:hypothetical protein|nr:hypothetical protein [Stellaceae bacterium]
MFGIGCTDRYASILTIRLSQMNWESATEDFLRRFFSPLFFGLAQSGVTTIRSFKHYLNFLETLPFVLINSRHIMGLRRFYSMNFRDTSEVSAFLFPP